MLDLFEQVHLLEYLSLAEVILHIVFLNRLDSHLLACQLVHTKCDFSKGSLTDKFNEFVEIESCGRQFVVLLDVLLDVFYQVVSLLQDRVVYLGRWFGRCSVVVRGLASVPSFRTCTGGLCVAA